MPDDLLTRAEKLKRWILNHRDASKVVGDPILRAQGVKLIDEHLATLDDLVEAAQFDEVRGKG